MIVNEKMDGTAELTNAIKVRISVELSKMASKVDIDIEHSFKILYEPSKATILGSDSYLCKHDMTFSCGSKKDCLLKGHDHFEKLLHNF